MGTEDHINTAEPVSTVTYEPLDRHTSAMWHGLPVPKAARYGLVAGCAAAILYASVLDPTAGVPGDGVPGVPTGAGGTAHVHVLAYAVLTALLAHARLAADRRMLLVAAVLATLYGAGIELLQGRLPYRTMAVSDVVLNAIGAAVGAAGWWVLAPLFGATRAADAERSG